MSEDVPVTDPDGNVVGRVVAIRPAENGIEVDMVLTGGKTASAHLPFEFAPAPPDATLRMHGRDLSDAEVAAFDALDDGADDYSLDADPECGDCPPFDHVKFARLLAEGRRYKRTEVVPLPGDAPPPESLYPRPGESDHVAGRESTLPCPSCGSMTCAHLVRVLADHPPKCPACGQTAEECGRFVKLVTDDEGSRVVHLDEDPDEETPC